MRVVNTTQMNYLRETAHPRTAVITGVTRPDVQAAQPVAAPVAPVVVPIVPPVEAGPLTP